MAHPLFARIDRQLELVVRELDNVNEADRRFRRLKALAASRKVDASLYHPWSHSASLADGHRDMGFGHGIVPWVRGAADACCGRRNA